MLSRGRRAGAPTVAGRADPRTRTSGAMVARAARRPDPSRTGDPPVSSTRARILHARERSARTHSPRAAPRPSPPHHAVESCPQHRSDCAMRMQTSAWPVASASRATQSNQLHHAVGTCAHTERPCTHRLQRSDLRPPTGSRTSDRLDDEPTCSISDRSLRSISDRRQTHGPPTDSERALYHIGACPALPRSSVIDCGACALLCH
jgi:hypothetical protein